MIPALTKRICEVTLQGPCAYVPVRLPVHLAVGWLSDRKELAVPVCPTMLIGALVALAVGEFAANAADERRHLQNGQDVLLDGELAEDARFLREITHAQPRAFVHGLAGDSLVLEEHSAFVGLHHPDDHVECCGFARAVRAEQAEDLA